MNKFKYKLVRPIKLPETTRPNHNELDEGSIDINLLDVHNDIGLIDGVELHSASRGMIAMSKCDSFQGKSFYLDSSYDWVIGKTSGNRIVLIPLNTDYPANSILKHLKNE
jgi:hypothetical protein